MLTAQAAREITNTEIERRKSTPVPQEVMNAILEKIQLEASKGYTSTYFRLNQDSSASDGLDWMGIDEVWPARSVFDELKKLGYHIDYDQPYYMSFTVKW